MSSSVEAEVDRFVNDLPPNRRRCGGRREKESGSRSAGTRLRIISAATVLILALAMVSGLATANAVPAPEVEYTYNVMVRRHFDFPNNDALGYGFELCDKATRGAPYADLMADTKRDVTPSDEQSANYVVSYAIGVLCPGQIWHLRDTAAGYRPLA